MSKINNNTLIEIAKKINSLNTSYTSGLFRHHQYMTEYDKILEAYNVSKKNLIEAIEEFNIKSS